MPASASFLSTCLATVQATPEYAAFAVATAALSAAGEDARQAKWKLAYDDAQPGLSPAYRLRRAVRDAIANAMVSQTVDLSPADREAAYQTLVLQVAPRYPQPVPPDARTPSFTQEDIDLIRLTVARAASD